MATRSGPHASGRVKPFASAGSLVGSVGGGSDSVSSGDDSSVSSGEEAGVGRDASGDMEDGDDNGDDIEDGDENDAEVDTDTYADADTGSDTETKERTGIVIEDSSTGGGDSGNSGSSRPVNDAGGNDVIVPVEEMVVEQTSHSLQGIQLGCAVQVPRPPQDVLSVPEKFSIV